jgi:glucose/arabinose dehydrogenase
MSFDPEDGRLWIGDVGQANFEEVSIIEAGTNHGWPIVEGFDCLVLDNGLRDQYDVVSGLPCTDTESFDEPLIAYEHTGKCAVVGGMVYRGSAMPWLRGTYFFGDYCSGQIWALEGDYTSGWRMIEIADLDKPLSSFGVDEDGEILVLTFGGPILRLMESESDHAPSVTHIPAATIVTLPSPADFALNNPDS